eukprot:TRINITY_DN10668_c0_g1_i2.p1 TRINITY_DN10668_c0_g1~~TRINITY_DN10668_c0_g1_i2.p1  ORF type:complete len:105 (+),score=5.19 TRINITY_DN10668_c0_g1_i2:336-650(+)
MTPLNVCACSKFLDVNFSTIFFNLESKASAFSVFVFLKSNFSKNISTCATIVCRYTHYCLNFFNNWLDWSFSFLANSAFSIYFQLVQWNEFYQKGPTISLHVLY